MKLGLEGKQRGEGALAMRPTFAEAQPLRDNVSQLPVIYAIDLGGSNFRVVRAQLKEDGADDLQRVKFALPEEAKLGSGHELFLAIARSLKSAIVSFGDEADSVDSKICVAMAFSFPMKHNSISSAVLTRWTKGFAARGVEGQDVASLLQHAIDEVGIQAKVVALINDTVAAFLAARRSDHRCCLGCVFGTGTNGAYLEKSKDMVIDINWGDFGSDLESVSLLPCTEVDLELDGESPNPGEMRFSKLVGGRFIGEITGRIVQKLIPELSQVNVRDKFTAALMAEIESMGSDKQKVSALLLSELGIQLNEARAETVTQVCTMVATRAAKLGAAAIAAVLQHVWQEGNPTSMVSVGVEGSVVKEYNAFRTTLEETLKALLGKEQSKAVRLVDVEDGPPTGAAFAAAQALDS